jgi:N6-L-threonylcarbamoyladenine synthase
MKKNRELILGIETSCDETAASLIKAEKGKIEILSNVVFSQIKLHQPFGGIVPEVASRAHLEKIIPVLKKAYGNYSPFQVNLICVTYGPGLITSLLIGIEAAKTLSYLTHAPLMAVNHLEGHIYSVENFEKIVYPAMALIVSGGHTKLINIKKPFVYQEVGTTLDDAAGECFDKISKFLGLGYPGGPIISDYASKWRQGKKTIDFHLPRPMLKKKNFDFSFSGLKTALIYSLRKKHSFPLEGICAEVEEAICQVLTYKTMAASREYKANSLILCGGVAANQYLRKRLKEEANKAKINFFCPPSNLATDNALMIALAGYERFKMLSPKEKEKLKNNFELDAKPNLYF